MSLHERPGQEVGIRTAVDDRDARPAAGPVPTPCPADGGSPQLRRHQPPA